jgi:hypothetical protein
VQHQVNISKVLEREIDDQMHLVDTDRTLVSVRSTPTALSDSSKHCGHEELTGTSDQRTCASGHLIFLLRWIVTVMF